MQKLNSLLSGRRRRSIRERDAMQSFPIFSGHHLDRVPGATIKESSIWTFAGAFLAPNTKIRINFDAAEGGMIFIRYPEHAGINGTVFDTGR